MTWNKFYTHWSRILVVCDHCTI